MLEGQLHHKLPGLSRSEDCLTSTVFGLLKYSVMRPVLTALLGRAVRHGDGSGRLGDVLGSSWAQADGEFKVRFWERHGHFGEPDLLLVGADWVVLIEVKLWAEVSGEDQLRKYHDLLKDHFSQKEHQHVVYLTQDLTPPILAEAVTRGIEQSLWWLSWYELSQVLEQADMSSPTIIEMVGDLNRLMNYCGLALFRGVTEQDPWSSQSLFWDDMVPLITSCEEWASGHAFFWRDSDEIR